MKALVITNFTPRSDKDSLFHYIDERGMWHETSRGNANVIFVDDDTADEVFDEFPFMEIDMLQAIRTLNECRNAILRDGWITNETDFAIDYNGWDRETLIPTGICKDESGSILMYDSNGDVVIRDERIFHVIPDFPGSFVTCDSRYYYIDLNDGLGEGAYRKDNYILQEAVAARISLSKTGSQD